MKLILTSLLVALGLSASVLQADTIKLGGTANIIAIDETRFTVAMTGVFRGGVFARITGSEKLLDNKNQVFLEHYFTNENGSFIFTKDVSVHTQVEGSRYYAETTYNVVRAGGEFEGYTGSFKSWGAFDYSTGVGVLRFEGELEKQ